MLPARKVLEPVSRCCLGTFSQSNDKRDRNYCRPGFRNLRLEAKAGSKLVATKGILTVTGSKVLCRRDRLARSSSSWDTKNMFLVNKN